MDTPKLSCGARVLYAILRGYQGKKCKQPFPSIKTLQAKLGVRDAIYGYLKELEDANLIVRIKERTAGKFRPNKYALLEGSPHTENQCAATEENGAKSSAEGEAKPHTKNRCAVGKSGENPQNSGNLGGVHDARMTPHTGLSHTAELYTTNRYTKDSHFLKESHPLKDFHFTMGTSSCVGAVRTSKATHHLENDAASNSSESRKSEKETPREKLKRIRRPKDIPSEIEFNFWVITELPKLAKRRPDLYGKLYSEKWHVWNRRRQEWEPIENWPKLCLGLAKKTETVAASAFTEPFIMEYQLEIIDYYNDFAARHAHLEFLPVNQLAPEVEKVIDLIADKDLDELAEILEREAQDPNGGRTLVRCFWNNS